MGAFVSFLKDKTYYLEISGIWERVQKIDKKDVGDPVRLAATPYSQPDMMGWF